MSGWRKIDTKFLEWRWAHKPEYVSFALHCILKANPQPKPFEKVNLQRGQFATSLEKFSTEIGVSIQTLRTMINNCVECGFITKKSTNRFIIITICNYDKYQSSEKQTNKQTTNYPQANNIQITSDSHATNILSTTTLEYKNIENKNIEESLNKNNEKSDSRDSEISMEILMQYVKDHNVNITEKGVRQFKKFNEKLPQPYNGGDLETAFENFLEKKFNRKYKKVSGPPPAVVSNPPPPQPLSLAEVAAKLQFHKDSQAKWDKVLDKLSETVNGNEIRTWFLPLKVDISEDNQRLQIVATKFLMETIEQKYAKQLKQSLIATFGAMPKVSYKI